MIARYPVTHGADTRNGDVLSRLVDTLNYEVEQSDITAEDYADLMRAIIAECQTRLENVTK